MKESVSSSSSSSSSFDGCVSNTNSDRRILSESICLPISKRKLTNRLIKSAMSEGLADPNIGDPNEYHYNLYERWSQNNNYSMNITGNVMVDRRYKEQPRNVVLDEESNLNSFRLWSKHIKGQQQQTLAIMQLSHPGRQCFRSSHNSNNVLIAPTGGQRGKLQLSGILGPILSKLLIRTPREIQTNEIVNIINQFVTSACLAKQTGFDGIQIHAAHGYLLSQFLSPTGNLRQYDKYGGTSNGRRLLLKEIILSIRNKIGTKNNNTNFIIGVKINIKDRSNDSISRENECFNLIKDLCLMKQLDFIELSGGSYEDPFMFHNVNDHFKISTTNTTTITTTNTHSSLQHDDNDSSSSLPFTYRLRDELNAIKEEQQQQQNDSNNENDNDDNNNNNMMPVIIVTGGFRTKQGMEDIIQLIEGNNKTKNNINCCIGLGRPTCIDPNFGSQLLLLSSLSKNNKNKSTSTTTTTTTTTTSTSSYTSFILKNMLQFNVTFEKKLMEPILNGLWYQRQLWLLSEKDNTTGNNNKESNPNLSIFWTLTVTLFRTYIYDWKVFFSFFYIKKIKKERNNS